jgi:hypothetical protein
MTKTEQLRATLIAKEASNIAANSVGMAGAAKSLEKAQAAAPKTVRNPNVTAPISPAGGAKTAGALGRLAAVFLAKQASTIAAAIPRNGRISDGVAPAPKKKVIGVKQPKVTGIDALYPSGSPRLP